MSEKQGGQKGLKKKRRSKGQSERYWNMAHTENMLKRALRIAKRSKHYKEPNPARDKAQALSFISLHQNGCKGCDGPLAGRFARATA